MTAAPTPEHAERALVRRVIDQQLIDVPVTTNPLAIALHMRLLAAQDGRVRLGFTVGDAFTQGNGVVQGGIVSAMLDFAMSFAAFSMVPASATVTTVAQTTNYFRPARSGEFTVEAELEKVGRTLINARASLRGPDGVLLASATAPIAVIARRTGG
jgi:uncharacterized protein (TIGR00369 family)